MMKLPLSLSLRFPFCPHPRTWHLGLLLTTISLAGCSAEVEDRCGPVNETPGPMMRPGQNCLRCHQEGFGEEDAPVFSAAGTIFDSAEAEHCDGVEGVKVYLMGADGQEIELTTNAAGNFWTRAPLMPEGPGPRIEFEDRSIEMQRALPTTPACNACHDNPPVGGAPGKIFVP